MQLAFDTREDIPAIDFEYFDACNRAPESWTDKRQFYFLKSEMLRKYGRADGHDLQIIQKKCWSCNGTGWYDNHCRCYKCSGRGIYATTAVALARYILNDQLFHIPLGRVSKDGYMANLKLEYHNSIIGYVKHEEVPNIQLDRAFGHLLILYAPQEAIKYYSAYYQIQDDLPF